MKIRRKRSRKGREPLPLNVNPERPTSTQEVFYEFVETFLFTLTQWWRTVQGRMVTPEEIDGVFQRVKARASFRTDFSTAPVRPDQVKGIDDLLLHAFWMSREVCTQNGLTPLTMLEIEAVWQEERPKTAQEIEEIHAIGLERMQALVEAQELPWPIAPT